MKQIRITTEAGDQTHLLAKGAVPSLVSGELTVALHDGQTLRVPNAAVLGYVVEDARKPTKLDALTKAHEEACEAVETAAEGVYVYARSVASVEDAQFRAALSDYIHACDARDAATEAIKVGQVAAVRAKAYAEKRKADKASGVVPAKKKPAKKAAKKAAKE